MITVKQIDVDDWQKFRQIRLFALKESPQAYGGSYEEAIDFPKEKWTQVLTERDRAVFGLFDGNKIIGLGFVRIAEENPHQAGLFMGYVAPDYRRKGLSKMLYQARIKWASDQSNIRSIVTFNKASNLAAQAMNKGFGFKLEKRKSREDWPDGSKDDELMFRLKL